MKSRILDISELEYWYTNHLNKDFPVNECKPMENILNLILDGKYDIYLYEENETIIGYASIWKAEGNSTFLLDYLGVPYNLRNKGYGSMILQDIRNQVTEKESCSNNLKPGTSICLILETETPETGDYSPENKIRERRESFYMRNNYVKLYEIGTCGVRFNAMSYSDIPEDLELTMIEHKKIYGPDRTDVVIPLPAGVDAPLPFWMQI